MTTRCSSPLLFFPKAKNNAVKFDRSSGSPGFLHLPAIQAVVLDSDTVFGLTAAGTAPALHRIPFSFLSSDAKTEISKFKAKIKNF
jgi:hypothetical protein